ncbi:MAG: TonB family protein [Terriglobales bacterium]|jgi:TonB family protein
MALRALFFSKNPDINTILTAVCQSAGVRVEVCDDIFTAIEKGTKQRFEILLVDWSSQPEAGFLVKRARESGPNKQFAAVAVVNRDPSAAEMREHGLEFLIHLPVSETEARDVLGNAMQKAQPGGAESSVSAETDEEPAEAARGAAESSPKSNADQPTHEDAAHSFESGEDQANEGENAGDAELAIPRNYALVVQQTLAVALTLAAGFLLWSGRDGMIGFARSPERKGAVLKESLVAYFHLEPPDTMPVISARREEVTVGPSATLSASDGSGAQSSQLQVVEGEPALDDSHEQLRKASDFPLPAPQLNVSTAAPPSARRANIPESIRSSAPIAPPVVVTVNPAQMMPVSSPSIPAPSSQTFTEPVPVSEETERGLLLHSVNPDYPAEALSQKLHGPVVLQATIGRDGSVEDLKIIRGYFVLGKAAIAAVKQWQFKPYSLNGHSARTQTVITVMFDLPQS